ncbi:MAG: GNAT family N-acetyltransferase [Candidatus Dormiibacterota bacterium]
MISAELAEAIRYARRIEALGSDDQGTWSGGVWLRARSLPQVYDVNHLIVLEEGFGMSMEEVSAAADEIQAELPNRIVEFVICAESDALAAAFRAAGWLDEPLGMMVRHREPDRHVDTAQVRVVDPISMRPARAASLADEPWATPDAVVQVREKQERVARGVPTTHLAVIVDQMVVSYCEVYRIDDIAQVESVATVPDHRRRGYARAVVTRALELTTECRLVFLGMDPDDWPQRLYSRLGMDDIGRLARFRKALPGSA